MAAPGWLRSIGGAIKRIPQNIMPVNPELEGLLGPELVGNARREGLLGLAAGLHAAGTGDAPGGIAGAMMTGRQAFNQSLGAGYAQKQGLEQAGQQQQMAAARKSIMDRFAPVANESTEQINEKLRAMYAEFVRIGDTEMVGRLSQVIPGISTSRQKPEGTWVTTPGPDGRPRRRFVTAEEAGREGIAEYEKPTRDTTDALTLNSRLMGEERLTKGYETAIAGVQTTVDAYTSATEAAKMGGAGDLQILYSFIRALDPTSVVREGEVALARQAAPLRSQAEVLAAKFSREGGTLSRVQKEQMLTLMKQMVDLKVERAEHAKRDTERRAQRFGLEVDLRDPLERYRRMTATDGGNVGASLSAAGASRVRAAASAAPAPAARPAPTKAPAALGRIY